LTKSQTHVQTIVQWQQLQHCGFAFDKFQITTYT